MISVESLIVALYPTAVPAEDFWVDNAGNVRDWNEAKLGPAPSNAQLQAIKPSVEQAEIQAAIENKRTALIDGLSDPDDRDAQFSSGLLLLAGIVQKIINGETLVQSDLQAAAPLMAMGAEAQRIRTAEAIIKASPPNLEDVDGDPRWQA